MNTVEKIQHIAAWTYDNYDGDVNNINHESGESDFTRIAQMVGEELPEEFLAIYTSINGEVGGGSGILFGHEFLSTKKIISNLEFALSLVKPTERKIIDPDKARALLDEISGLFLKSIPNKKKFGFISKKWHKATFSCSPDSYSQITVEYENGETEKYTIKEAYADSIFDLGYEIHQLEKKDYNWDSLLFEARPDGKYTVTRKDDVWDEARFSSCPKDMIKKKYCHYKWIPVFHDFSGNFIGIDLDPDKAGSKGQIIIFGSDEENMVVVADSLAEFLDLSIEEMTNHPEAFASDTHVHDIYRRIKKCA